MLQIAGTHCLREMNTLYRMTCLDLCSSQEEFIRLSKAFTGIASVGTIVSLLVWTFHVKHIRCVLEDPYLGFPVWSPAAVPGAGVEQVGELFSHLPAPQSRFLRISAT